jgi:hypothetical protein
MALHQLGQRALRQFREIAASRQTQEHQMKERQKKVARPARFERATLCLEGRCSIQLSYGRILCRF